MIRWIEVNVGSYWNPNRFVPHAGLFEGLLGDDLVMLHSWGETYPKINGAVQKGFSFRAKNVDRIDVAKIRQRHILVREQYMFFFEEADSTQINYNGLVRFLWDVEMMDKIVYLPYFREMPTHTKSVHTDCWSVLQDYICEYFDHEFYFDYDAHDKGTRIAALRRQIALDDLL